MKSWKKRIFALILVLTVFALEPLTALKAATAEPAATVTKKTLYVGGDNYKILFKNLAEGSTVTYSSSDKTVAKVTTAGVIKPLAVGTATITVKIKQSGKTYTSKIAVTVRNPYVKITNPVETLTVGDTYKFEAKTYGLLKTSVTWAVSNKTVATINTKTRTLTALKAGTVKVTFKDTLSGKSSSCTIQVVEPVVEEEEELEEDELFGYEVVDKKAVITEIYDTTLTSLEIPNKLGGYKVTEIDDGAFEGMTDLTYVSFPSTITRIGDYAFGSCSSLKSIQLPSGLKELGCNAFEFCESLASINIPAGVEIIEEGAFADCYALKTVTINEGTKEIGEEAFANCESLTSLTLPKTITDIGDSAFSECIALSKITFNSGLLSIGDYAFECCTALTTVTLPSTLTYLGSGAFDSCESLKSATIPSSVEEVGAGAFDYCSESLKLKVKKNSAGYEYAVDYEIPYTTY